MNVILQLVLWFQKTDFYNDIFSGWFNLLFRPFGYKVLRRRIQLPSCDSRIDVISSDTFFSILSMIVNFASLEKLWFAR